MKVLVTGSCGLIGSEAVTFYDKRADLVVGIDNNMRAQFFGPGGDTTWMQRMLQAECGHYRHESVDIRDRERIPGILSELIPDLIIHCAAQPSHDLAASIPLIDFEVNALGTLNLLEATRRHAPGATFILMSTNKVYGDAPNNIQLKELQTRWEYDDPRYINGIPESFTIDQSKHSLFGVSKLASDVMVQEYGRYFGIRSAVFRGGCLTGSRHSGVESHGFLSYLCKVALKQEPYTIYGYKGKQVRDQIHSSDVVNAVHEFTQNPSCGAVYNLGGGKNNSVSILESIDRIEQLTGRKLAYSYCDTPRAGDHICYYSDLTKFKQDYPNWRITQSLDDIFEDIVVKEYASASSTSNF